MVEINRLKPTVVESGRIPNPDMNDPEDLEELMLFQNSQENLEDEDRFEFVDIEEVNETTYVVEQAEDDNNQDTTNKIRDILDTMGLTINYTLQEIFKANRHHQEGGHNDDLSNQVNHHYYTQTFEELHQLLHETKRLNSNMWLTFKVMVIVCLVNTLLVFKIVLWDKIPDFEEIFSCFQ